jgi:hypothetical protein
MTVTELTPGQIVLVSGEPGLWRVVERCRDATGRAWWMLPCHADGTWNRKEGWHAHEPSRCSVPKAVRVRRHYNKKEGEGQ